MSTETASSTATETTPGNWKADVVGGLAGVYYSLEAL